MKWLAQKTLDGGLDVIPANVTRMALLRTYAFGDDYATMASNIIAEVSMSSGDFAKSTQGNNRRLTSASGKTATASGSSNQYSNGTATSGSTTALNDTGKAWTTNEHANRAVTIIAGTGAGQTARITSNTSTGLTFPAMAVALDNTSQYIISDDLHIAFLDADEGYWVTDEGGNKVVSAGNLVEFPSLQLNAVQPT